MHERKSSENVDDNQTQAEADTTTKAKSKAHFTGKYTYDLDEIDRFLDRVFHVEPEEGEEILCWRVPVKRKPAFPVSDVDLVKNILPRTQNPSALYYGTATMVKDPKTGLLRNRKSLFKSLRVIVLDDIGTKIPLDKLPPELAEPSYKLESSEGNWQYGLVLAEPVTDLAAAECLVQMVFDSGLTDSGGKMPNKLVRLPGGVNGKDTPEKIGYQTKLEMPAEPKVFTPQEIIKAIGLGVDWADVLADAERVTRERAHINIGASAWSDVKPASMNLNGVIDPVLEWLFEQGMVEQDSDDWVIIRCPNADQHTAGGDEYAGYSPIGRGDRPDSRGFNCFHDHCSGFKTNEFLAWVAEQSGIQCGITDAAAELLRSWVYDNSNHSAWEIAGVSAPIERKMQAFLETFPKSVLVQTPDGPKKVKETALWRQRRTLVYGAVFDPTNPCRIVTCDGKPHVNTYAPPDWGDVSINDEDVQMFTEFVDFLMPVEEERKFFLDWLSAKAQSMAFRGPAILMVTSMQGTGRTTLTDMIATMFERWNIKHLPFDKIIGEAEFNEWMVSPFVFCDETFNVGEKNFFKAYERLKDMIDPRPKVIMVNQKYGAIRWQRAHSSFLMSSNHPDALCLPEEDRRIYVLRNADKPKPPEFYVRLNRWLESNRDSRGRPRWARSIWHWLRSRDVDVDALLEPVKMTKTKESMIEEARSELDIFAAAIVHSWPSHGIICSRLVEDLVLAAGYRARLKPEDEVKVRTLQRKIRQRSVAMGNSVKIGRYSARPRLLNIAIPHSDHDPSAPDSLQLTHDLNDAGACMKEITARINEYMDINGTGA